MSLLPIILVLVVMVADEGLKPIGSGLELSHPMVASIACLPVVMFVLAACVSVRRCERLIQRGKVHGPLMATERTIRIARWLIVITHIVAVLVFGWLDTVRSVTTDLVLVDEMCVVLVPVLGFAGIWWAYYPLEKRLREALLIRALDEGRPLFPPISRWQYVSLQVRMQLLLLLVPLFLIVGFVELAERIAEAVAIGEEAQWITDVASMAIALGVFILAPALARRVLDVEPMPDGSLRTMLINVCRTHRVRVRDILLWKTNGYVVNAAVMGLLGRLRYVLITDALLEMLPPRQVEAVMAHETGHVRKHHMFWLVASLMAALAIGWLAVSGALYVLLQSHIELVGENAFHYTATAGQLIFGLLAFGWVSRRFERQADTFAVTHLTMHGGNENPEAHLPGHITSEAVEDMCESLSFIARVNAIDPRRRSWRHGSIAWRQRYLRSLIGRPVLGLPIDRLVRGITLVSLFILIAVTAVAVFWQ